MGMLMQPLQCLAGRGRGSLPAAAVECSTCGHKDIGFYAMAVIPLSGTSLRESGFRTGVPTRAAPNCVPIVFDTARRPNSAL